MKNYKVKILLYIIFFFALMQSCKKIDPDCATCPCPLCPRIETITPNHGRPGDTVLLKGVNFNEDPTLNLITFNDTLVLEILEGTTTELKVVVPEGTSTGPVKIKINDEVALSSDEIPDFNEPVFTLDHFVELVAGTPEFSGFSDGPTATAQFTSLNKIAVDNLNKNIYTVSLNNLASKTIRKIDSVGVSTIFTATSDTGLAYNLSLTDLTSSSTNKVYFVQNQSALFSTKIKFVNSSGVVNNLLSQTGSSLDNRIYGPHIFLDQDQADIYYTEYHGYLSSTFPFPFISEYSIYKRRLLIIGADPAINIATFSSASAAPNVDMEYKNGYIYYFTGGSNSNRTLVKRKAEANSTEILIKSNIVDAGGLAIDTKGQVFYSTAHRIFKLNDQGQEELIAGSFSVSNSGYNQNLETGLNSLFYNIKDIDFDRDNNLYIVDAGNYCIRRLKID